MTWIHTHTDFIHTDSLSWTCFLPLPPSLMSQIKKAPLNLDAATFCLVSTCDVMTWNSLLWFYGSLFWFTRSVFSSLQPVNFTMKVLDLGATGEPKESFANSVVKVASSTFRCCIFASLFSSVVNKSAASLHVECVPVCTISMQMSWDETTCASVSTFSDSSMQHKALICCWSEPRWQQSGPDTLEDTLCSHGDGDCRPCVLLWITSALTRHLWGGGGGGGEGGGDWKNPILLSRQPSEDTGKEALSREYRENRALFFYAAADGKFSIL